MDLSEFFLRSSDIAVVSVGSVTMLGVLSLFHYLDMRRRAKDRKFIDLLTIKDEFNTFRRGLRGNRVIITEV